MAKILNRKPTTIRKNLYTNIGISYDKKKKAVVF